MSRPRDPQVGTLGTRPLPPRLDPRAGRPPRVSSSRPRGGARPGPRDGVRPPARPTGRAAMAAEPAADPGFGRVLGLTTVGAVLPGVAFLAAGYRRVGWLLLTALAGLLALGAWLATGGSTSPSAWP
ncbi:hypothetical protein [Blastococcus sp. PRF04-17]|uniref:hypothetical protein n=1 Tax=Blastococcus sp. PRF04-17 TaxID=2933797 RepID=UPI001FF6B6A2|nr:hypothetical protein [Blastococcus sp. PRF04-17]UOY01210.1 hypothetical protein MVA48_19995 [Blastococcus sp. PRF04-17]